MGDSQNKVGVGRACDTSVSSLPVGCQLQTSCQPVSMHSASPPPAHLLKKKKNYFWAGRRGVSLSDCVVSSVLTVLWSGESGVHFCTHAHVWAIAKWPGTAVAITGSSPAARAQRAAHGPASLLQQATVTAVCDLLGGRREPGMAVPAPAMVKGKLGNVGDFSHVVHNDPHIHLFAL